jgi:hypothetical protein
MPVSIVRFERCAWISLMLNLVPPDDRYLGQLPFVFVFALIWGGSIWVTARRQKNWGRWLYAALTALSVGGTGWAILTGAFWTITPPQSRPLILLADVLSLAAVYFLFAPGSHSWFQGKVGKAGS